jgi:ectoine hydroxylase-related dioxygenase (phytanoyl-CoA dioxygenase family)
MLKNLWGPYSRVSFTRYIAQLPKSAPTITAAKHGNWHSDWPYGQRYEGHILSPYPDTVFTITTVWMLSPFTAKTGATFMVPGSHRATNNPTGGYGVDEDESYQTEVQVTGEPGDVLMFDARTWHAAGINVSERPRSAMRICWVPWWLNVNILDPESVERQPMEVAGRAPFVVRKIPIEAYERLPKEIKPLFNHWVKN